MAGLDKIISQIKEESQETAARTLAAARDEAEKVLAAARKEAESECADIERRSRQSVALLRQNSAQSRRLSAPDLSDTPQPGSRQKSTCRQ